jgi:hypothetical protein
MPKLVAVKWVLTSVSRMAKQIVLDPGLIQSIPFRHPLDSAWELGEPWWPAPAIRHLDEQLPANARVFEWGSGGSTVWLARRGADVVAIESEREWHRLVSERVPEADVRFVPGTDTGTLRSEPELRDHGQHFFDEYVAAIEDFPDGAFDLIIIDGIARCECARRATSKVKPNGLVVLDDTNWEHLFAPAFLSFRGWEVTRFRGFKRPLDVHVSETTFLRRPL